MEFNVNHPILFVMVGIIIAAVLGQSFYFLFRAVKRARELGIAKGTVKSTITSAAIFTIAPAVAVLVGVVALSKSLGIALASPLSEALPTRPLPQAILSTPLIWMQALPFRRLPPSLQFSG